MAKVAKKAKAKPAPNPLDEPSAELGLGLAVGNYGARASQVKMCGFCKHSYLKPCTDKTKEKCPNYRHLQSRGKSK